MRIQSNKVSYNGIGEINIQGIDCTYENVNTALKVFDFNQTLITVDSIDNNSDFLLTLECFNLEHTWSDINANTKEISAIIPFGQLRDLLEVAIQSNPENIFITNIRKPINIREIPQTSPICIIKNGFSDVIVVIARDEHVIHFTFDSKVYSHKEVSNRLRELFCKHP